MLKEALEYLFKVGADRRAAVIQTGSPAHLPIIERRDGTIEHLELKPAPREHTALDTTAVIAFAKANPTCSVWYSREGMTCLIDDATRRDKIVLSLKNSPQMEKLHELVSATGGLKQASMILMLRTTFGNCEQSADLVKIFRSIKFTANGEYQSDLQHGKASVGESLRKQMSGTSEIPETVTFDVPVFNGGFGTQARIKLATDIDTENKTFKLIPMPMELEKAYRQSEKEMGEQLKRELPSTPIYYGTPS